MSYLLLDKTCITVFYKTHDSNTSDVKICQRFFIFSTMLKIYIDINIKSSFSVYINLQHDPIYFYSPEQTNNKYKSKVKKRKITFAWLLNLIYRELSERKSEEDEEVS